MKITKKIQRVLVLVLTVVMMMASVLTVSAATGEGGSGEGGSGEGGGGTVETPSETPAPSAETSSSGEASQESSDSDAVNTPSIRLLAANGSTVVGGTSMKTTVAGVYAAKSVEGAAVTTPLADIRASLGLKDSQTPHIVIFDTDAKKSNLAMKCVNDAVKALNGTLVAVLNINLRALENGKFITLSEGSVGLVVGLPKNADTSKTYSVVCVQPGGVVTILKDQDDSPTTVTFEVKAGLATYAIVAD